MLVLSFVTLILLLSTGDCMRGRTSQLAEMRESLIGEGGGAGAAHAAAVPAARPPPRMPVQPSVAEDAVREQPKVVDDQNVERVKDKINLNTPNAKPRASAGAPVYVQPEAVAQLPGVEPEAPELNVLAYRFDRRNGKERRTFKLSATY